ncbi:ABC transporter ATP-binding protein/permease [Phytoactinopolyspora halotolerans]|uniref:ABC transporter ATP-binding protein n=1 Tax=Phytoactinopolyspora halotolerans TaxID=1981512 RepID=A0A6L9S9M8_9ACTN|nr:ABC transporter ATP-binding protein [Phytoactinopolyspora halotolerans]NEE01936.1 ABC transporter ATP-binding protein [Phytoactinopolyspora halotolerans]
MLINRTVLRFVTSARGHLALTVLLGLAASAAAVGTAFALAEVVARVLSASAAGSDAGRELGDALAPLAVAAALTLTRAGLLWWRDQCAVRAAIDVKHRVRARLVRHLFALGPAHARRTRSGGVQATLVDGVEHLQAYVGFYLPQVVVSLVVPATLVGILATRDVAVAVLVAVGVLSVPIAQRLWKRLLGERADVHWKAFESYAARIADTLAGIVTLISLGATRRAGQRLAEQAEQLRAATSANLRASLGVYIVTATAMSAGTAGATVLAAVHAAQGSLRPSDVLLVLFLAAECFRPLQDLQTYWHEGFYGLSAARGIAQLLDTPPVVAERPDAAPASLRTPPALSVDDVTYRYPGATQPALREVSLQIPAGSTVAVVGPSGAGKSTLVQLLLRDLDPDSGTVAIDGHDLRDLPLNQLRRTTALVAQDVVLLDGSVWDNIRLAAPDADDAQIMAAVRAARVDELADSLPNGLDTPVGERGGTLSGGQRQRVALARALVARAPVLVLDEATSALDAENEALVTEALHGPGADARTTIVVAHRLSTVARSDLIVVLDAGRVVEAGPPAELARMGGAWARMLQIQRASLQTAGAVR